MQYRVTCTMHCYLVATLVHTFRQVVCYYSVCNNMSNSQYPHRLTYLVKYLVTIWSIARTNSVEMLGLFQDEIVTVGIFKIRITGLCVMRFSRTPILPAIFGGLNTFSFIDGVVLLDLVCHVHCGRVFIKPSRGHLRQLEILGNKQKNNSRM